MDGCRRSKRFLAISTCLALMLVISGGCTQLLFTVAYLGGWGDDDAECNVLKGKTVVVVCRPTSTLQFSDPRVAREIARKVAKLLEENVSKIKLVDQRKVDRWTDEHKWAEFDDVGKALEAEVVVGIDLLQFDLFEAQTLLHGKASVSLRVVSLFKEVDKKKVPDVDVAFEKDFPRITYPPYSSISTADRDPSQFRKEFIDVIANQLARVSYSHDPNDDVGQDAEALK